MPDLVNIVKGRSNREEPHLPERGWPGFASVLVGLIFAIAGCVHDAESAGAPEAQWDRRNVEALIGAVDDLAAEGLSPADYDVKELRVALQAGNDTEVNAAASKLFTQIATDLSQGLISPDRRARWAIKGAAVDPEAVNAAMETALLERRVAGTLVAFAPDHPQYALLKAALAKTETTTDPEKRARLRLNMERWRWMPRDPGAEYILVNVPSFDLIVVRNGAVIDRRRVIVGAPKTPTPQFAATVTGLTFNPTWHVPASIVAEGVGALLESDPDAARKQGYYVAADGGVRQKPGPANALGRMKLEMPNPFSVFLHDTPQKPLFQRETRAFSHGCIRVEGALDLAQTLMAPTWDKEIINDVVSTATTVTVKLDPPIPVYITYFTAVADADAVVSFYPDIYRRDQPFLTDFNDPQTPDSTALGESAMTQGCPATAKG